MVKNISKHLSCTFFHALIEPIMYIKDWVITKFKIQNQVTEDMFEEFNNLDVDNE